MRRRMARTHFTSIGYNPKLRPDRRSGDTKFAASVQFAFPVAAIPCHEAADPLRDRRVRTEAELALHIRDVGAGFRDIAGLHRHELGDRGASRRLFDQPQHLVDLDRAAVADVVEPPRRAAPRRVRPWLNSWTGRPSSTAAVNRHIAMSGCPQGP